MIATENLTPLDELINVKHKFISLRDVIRTIESIYDMRHEDIAEWLIMKLCVMNKILTVESKGIAGAIDKYSEDEDNVILIQMLSDVIVYGEDVIEPYFNQMGYEDDNVTPYEMFRYVGFMREDIEKITGITFDIGFFSDDYEDEDYESDSELHQTEEDNNIIAMWENTYGMETARKIIAGLAIVIAANDKRYQRKDGLNKSAVVRVAENALNKYGGFIGVSDRQLTALISESLKSAPKLKDYTDSEQP
ncbi:hypothetical protein MLB55_005758 [Salmonella enterica]|uniref:Uncharacterized protein n=1 Tax=Salmonella newport TaxID=108619 RepID=A0A5W5FN88_SALNE|nr:hypothetical protein [Salmonella enterica]EBV0465754.1 hypothetical protein [Salmonella enterica subsp. enterica serovar Newport]EBX1212873.1 hypothetical protein [Salmonella enterica subsp. enterica serovar Newport]ECB1916282.1 hypothetical protein [Salmonella enterica subsp. enterica serovar Newport]ECV8662680.1 hypothetical protein [Salmonella enterica subsp. enterica serovar Newport]